MRTAFRDVRVDDWKFSVNGERLFLKGANLAPTRMALADATVEEIRRDLVLAQDANLDFVRVHAHVARPELYDAADELGLLVWQDLPAAVGLRARRAPAGRAPGARDGRPARPPPERRSCGARTTRRSRPTANRASRGRAARC